MGHGMQGAELTGCEITKDERTIDPYISRVDGIREQGESSDRSEER